MHHQLAALHQPVHRQAAAAAAAALHQQLAAPHQPMHQQPTKHQHRTDEDDHHDHATQLYRPMYREYRGHRLTWNGHSSYCAH